MKIGTFIKYNHRLTYTIYPLDSIFLIVSFITNEVQGWENELKHKMKLICLYENKNHSGYERDFKEI